MSKQYPLIVRCNNPACLLLQNVAGSAETMASIAECRFRLPPLLVEAAAGIARPLVEPSIDAAVFPMSTPQLRGTEGRLSQWLPQVRLLFDCICVQSLVLLTSSVKQSHSDACKGNEVFPELDLECVHAAVG